MVVAAGDDPAARRPARGGRGDPAKEGVEGRRDLGSHVDREHREGGGRRWRWASFGPGTVRRPARSITRVPGPRRAAIACPSPVAKTRSARTARAMQRPGSPTAPDRAVAEHEVGRHGRGSFSDCGDRVATGSSASPRKEERRGSRKGWSERRDSNPRPPAPHAGALPGCATLRPAATGRLADYRGGRGAGQSPPAVEGCEGCGGSPLGDRGRHRGARRIAPSRGRHPSGRAAQASARRRRARSSSSSARIAARRWRAPPPSCGPSSVTGSAGSAGRAVRLPARSARSTFCAPLIV